MLRANRDLLVIWLLLALGSLVLLGPTPPLLRASLWVPLACFCPGYCYTAGLFPRRTLGWPEVTAFSIGLSLAALILGAIMLNGLGVVLGQAQWAGLVLVVALTASLFALARRRRQPAEVGRVSGLPRLARGQWVLLGLAVLITTGALLLATTPLPAAGVQGYTTFWMLPDDDAAVPGLQLGIASAELTDQTYRVVVAAGAAPESELAQVTLAPGETWEANIVIPPELLGASPIEARLYRQANPGTIYRVVTVWR